MARREQMSVGELTFAGISRLMTTHTVSVLARNAAGDVLVCSGADIPHDTDVGFARGCMFIRTGTGAVYFNVGTAASANFDIQGTVVADSLLNADINSAAGIVSTKLAVPRVNSLSSGIKDHADFTDNAGTATGYFDFATAIPEGAIVLGWKANVTEGFAGDTTAVIQVGISGTLDKFSVVTTQSVLNIDVVGASVKAGNVYLVADNTVRVTVTGAADWGNITAGKVNVTVYYIETV